MATPTVPSAIGGIPSQPENLGGSETHHMVDYKSLPHDVPIPEGNTSGSAEGSKTLKELTDLCTHLSDKVTTLEAELTTHKKVFGKVSWC